MIENDWLDHEFIRDHTTGFEQLAASVQEWTPAHTAEVTGITEKAIRQAAEWWGTAKTSFLMHARGIEHHSHGVQNCLGAINIVLASGRIGREGCGYATITGQANGQGGREHGQKCDQLPGARDLSNPEHRAHVAAVWGVPPESLPAPGVDAYEIFRKIDKGEIKGLLSICFNPVISLPDNTFVRRMLEKLDFYVAIDFFLSETGRYANVVLPGSLQEEDEGIVTSTEGRVIKINPAVKSPGEAKQDWRIIQDIAQALERPHGFTFESPREILNELRAASKGGIADYSGITYEKIEKQMGVFWPCPSDDHPGTPRLFEKGSWNPIAKGKRTVLFSRWPRALRGGTLFASHGSDRRRIPAHSYHRTRHQPFPVGRADAPHRSTSGSMPGPLHRTASRTRRQIGTSRWRLGDRGITARFHHASRQSGAHDSARTPSLFLITGAGARAPIS